MNEDWSEMSRLWLLSRIGCVVDQLASKVQAYVIDNDSAFFQSCVPLLPVPVALSLSSVYHRPLLWPPKMLSIVFVARNLFPVYSSELTESDSAIRTTSFLSLRQHHLYFLLFSFVSHLSQVAVRMRWPWIVIIMMYTYPWIRMTL